MSASLAFILLLASTLTLLLLPFLPGLIVLWRKQDATPLRVVRSDDVDPRYFARRFRAYIRTNLESSMHGSRKAGDRQEGLLGGRTPYLLVTGENKLKLSKQEVQEREISRMLVSNADLILPDDLIFSLELFAGRTVRGGERNIYRAILADGDIVIGAESMLLRWMHAAGNVKVGPNSLLHGRVSSDSTVRLESGCRFERLHAPRIEFGKPESFSRPVKRLNPLESHEVQNLADVTGRRWLIDHKSELPSGRIVNADMVFTGEAWIGAGTHIYGSVKGHKDIFLGEGVRIMGSVVSVHDIYVGASCEIHGPVLSEKSVNVGRGAIIGDSRSPTTISAKNIYVSLGAVAHGTVWTRLNGMVNGAASA